MRHVLLLALVLVVAGCKDLPTAPVFDSPVDPNSEGDRRPAAPLGVAVSEVSGEVVAVRWLDVSSFEVGYKVEVATGEIDPATGRFVFGAYRVALDLPPDTDSATLPLSREASAFAIRVVGSGPDGVDGFRSLVRYAVRSQGIPYRLGDVPPFRSSGNAVAFGPSADRVTLLSPRGAAVSFEANTGLRPALLGPAEAPLRGGSGVVLTRSEGDIVGFTGAGAKRDFPNGTSTSAVSLRGGRVAFLDGGSVRIETVPEAGAEPDLVTTIAVLDSATGLVLSPDGEVLYVAENARVRAYAVTDGRVLWESGFVGSSPWLTISSDGSRIGYSRGTSAGILTSAGEPVASGALAAGAQFVVGATSPAGVAVDGFEVRAYDIRDGALVAREGVLRAVVNGVAGRLVDVAARARGNGVEIVVATALVRESDVVGHRWVVGPGDVAAAFREDWVFSDDAP